MVGLLEDASVAKLSHLTAHLRGPRQFKNFYTYTLRNRQVHEREIHQGVDAAEGLLVHDSLGLFSFLLQE